MEYRNLVMGFVKAEVLDYTNIKNNYDKEDRYDYKQCIFNWDDRVCIDFYNKFKEYVCGEGFEIDLILSNVINPSALVYAIENKYELEYDIANRVNEWISDSDNYYLLNWYCFYITDDIIDKYQDFINDVFNDTTTKRVAIDKLKRNRIVNEGFLLKVSMMRCGMFD
jgi:hypothetical protein|tara:strand:- start:1149 stop:1649 length:501 start_codon:yes stop_codon:yes gene_type:complete